MGWRQIKFDQFIREKKNKKKWSLAWPNCRGSKGVEGEIRYTFWNEIQTHTFRTEERNVKMQTLCTFPPPLLMALDSWWINAQTHCVKRWICYPANYTGDPEQNNVNNRKARLINTAVDCLVGCARSARLFWRFSSLCIRSHRAIGLKHSTILSCYAILNMHECMYLFKAFDISM